SNMRLCYIVMSRRLRRSALFPSTTLFRSLGLTRRESELPLPQLGEASPGRWPQLSVTEPRSQPTRLADRAISGIRSQSKRIGSRSEEHTSELQSRENIVCRLLLERKKLDD